MKKYLDDKHWWNIMNDMVNTINHSEKLDCIIWMHFVRIIRKTSIIRLNIYLISFYS